MHGVSVLVLVCVLTCVCVCVCGGSCVHGVCVLSLVCIRVLEHVAAVSCILVHGTCTFYNCTLQLKEQDVNACVCVHVCVRTIALVVRQQDVCCSSFSLRTATQNFM